MKLYGIRGWREPTRELFLKSAYEHIAAVDIVVRKDDWRLHIAQKSEHPLNLTSANIYTFIQGVQIKLKQTLTYVGLTKNDNDRRAVFRCPVRFAK